MGPLDIVLVIVFLICSYLIGAIPFGLVIGKLVKKTDIRKQGSKNIGATNAVRVLGLKLGACVFLLDVLKGLIFMIIAKILINTGVWENGSKFFIGYYGLAAVIGHCFSIYLKFAGGKAIATSIGVVLFLTPAVGVFGLLVFLAVFFSFGYISLASTSGDLAIVIISLILFFVKPDVSNSNFLSGFLPIISLENLIIYLVFTTIIIYKHRGNYKRLLSGTESRFLYKNK